MQKAKNLLDYVVVTCKVFRNVGDKNVLTGQSREDFLLKSIY